ncbi:hypothetical protein BST83_10260 [Polaribacter filamentus]|uniref:Uncharacterized protein n=1 Tax=Polaribacter filamentus TaxID=53483 RepID=A0A2S7KXY8_9FLAO|nr:hypothetical protein [Polaribacter filamentus]PQB07501.1 hypothetical protein BST83_10260 [Polaribacter filamentus]
MPLSNSIKGLQNIKSMQTVNKSGIPNKEGSDFLKLYILDKEKGRLQKEEIRAIHRLEVIQKRLNEIQEISNENIDLKQHIEKTKKTDRNNKENWQTMSIDY